MSKIEAPFTELQIASINEYQHCGKFHPFTCAACKADENNDEPLVAFEYGMQCLYCPYVQKWVHDFMADWSWKIMTGVAR